MLKKSTSLLLILMIITSVFSALPLSASAERTDSDIVSDTQPTETVAATEAQTEAPTVGATEAPVETPTEAPADYPVITGFENRSDGVKLTWEKFEGNTAYRIYYRKAAVYDGTREEKYGSGSWTRLGTVTGTSYIHKGVADAEIGIYTIRAVDSKGNFTSGYNSKGWENCYYAEPSISFIAPADDGVHLSWNQSWTKHGFYNGELYRIYRKTSGGGWKRIAAGLDASSYIDTTAAPGSVYTYTVRMTDSTDSNFLSGYNAGRAVATYVPVTKIENAENGAKLSWSPFGGAAGYRIYYRTNSGWTRLGKVVGTSFTDTSVKDGATRTYTVRAVNSKDAFISSYKTAGWKNTYFAAPQIKSLSNVAEGVKLSWTRTQGAGEYRVYRKTTGGWQRLAQTADSSYTDATAVSGVTYTYTLRIVDPATESFMSAYRSGKSVTYVGVPVIKNIENVSGGAKLTWDKVAGADNYRIYYRNSSAKSWTRLGSKYLPEFIDTTVKNGETREYTLRCMDAKDNFAGDYLREGYVNTYYAPPVIKSISDTDSGVKLTWDRANGAEDYRIYRRTGSSAWSRIARTNASTYTDTSASNGVTYTYTLRMVSAGGDRFMSSYNSGKSITHQGVPAISSATNGSDGIVIRWTPVHGVDYYRVYYKNGSSWTRLAQVSATSYTDTSVKDGMSRTYTVRGVNDSGSFVTDFKRTGKTQTYYAPPVMESIAYVDGAYTFTWSDKSGAAGYRVYRKALGDADWTALIDMANTTSITDANVEDGYAYAYTVRAQNKSGELITGFISNPFYVNGTLAAEAETDFRFDENGQPFTGYLTEDGALVYYRGGVRVEQDQYKNGVYNESYNRSEWLYELLSAAGSAPDCDPDDGAAVFALAKERGIIDSYTEEEYFTFVSRRYAANTMVKALGYGKRSVEHVTDLGSADSALMTLAYYGYFIPDSSDKLYPERVLSASEFDSLISELHLYKALKGKKVVSFGDSIMYGSGNDGHGMSEMAAEKYGMRVYDYSYPGAVMGEYSGKSHIPTQVRHAIAASAKPDIILINGGTNDAFRTSLGNLTDGYDMSAIPEASFTNGFEKAMYLIRSEWGHVPVIYVRSHNMILGADKDERAFGERGLAIAEKWNAAGIDLYNNSGMNAENTKIRDRYTWYDPDKGYHDTIHPTALGYAEFYLPAIGEVLAAAFGG